MSLFLALRVDNLLEQSEEVYLVTLIVGQVEDEHEQNLKDIPVIREYDPRHPMPSKRPHILGPLGCLLYYVHSHLFFPSY